MKQGLLNTSARQKHRMVAIARDSLTHVRQQHRQRRQEEELPVLVAVGPATPGGKGAGVSAAGGRGHAPCFPAHFFCFSFPLPHTGKVRQFSFYVLYSSCTLFPGFRLPPSFSQCAKKRERRKEKRANTKQKAPPSSPFSLSSVPDGAFFFFFFFDLDLQTRFNLTLETRDRSRAPAPLSLFLGKQLFTSRKKSCFFLSPSSQMSFSNENGARRKEG